LFPLVAQPAKVSFEDENVQKRWIQSPAWDGQVIQAQDKPEKPTPTPETMQAQEPSTQGAGAPSTPQTDTTSAATGSFNINPSFGPATDSTLGGSGGNTSLGLRPISAELTSSGSVATPGSLSIVPGGSQSQIYNTIDAGSLISDSPTSVGVEAQRRSPIATETRIRGYHLGQVVTSADGVYWVPARQDLDTFLSKIDSGVVSDVVIVRGPYSTLYGPGFSFVDIVTAPAPRYDGLEVHGRTTFNYSTNGEQLYGRQTVLVGDTDWGARLSYGHRTGNDYEMGNGEEIPSSFNSRDIDFVASFDITRDSTIEFGYLRLDQTNLEFPGQIFDTRFLVTDGYRARYTLNEQTWFDRLTVEGFYNRTRLEGDAQRDGKRNQIPVLGPVGAPPSTPSPITGQPTLGFTGFTDIDQSSAGYRVLMSWGNQTDGQLIVGTDFRFLKQELNEQDSLFGLPCFENGLFGIPRSHHGTVGGLFAEALMPISEEFKVRGGVRGDFVFANVDRIPENACSSVIELLRVNDVDQLDRDYQLFMAYVGADYKLTQNLTLFGNAGHGQRPPTMTELYSVQPFLAILQNGFTTVVGNPHLDEEKLTQFDLGLRYSSDSMRGSITGFYAHIQDYITYRSIDEAGLGASIFKIPRNFFGTGTVGQTVRFENTELATLAGVELYGEYDLTTWLTPFASMAFVAGRDQTLDEALPQIPPLDGRAGLRFHEADLRPTYGLEVSTRMVARQSQVATSLGEAPTAGFSTVDLRSYWQARDNLLLTAGVENLLDRFYREHLDLRTGRGVYQPGISAYFGVQVSY
jgi:outer membrane receptor protein involved in Fe transport